MIDPNSADLTIGAVGAGAMGQGIVQVALAGGMTVLVHDARDGGAEAGIETVEGRLARLVEKERLSADDKDAMMARVRAVDDLSGFAECQVVIEAVFEDLELKQSIFRELEGHVASDCILASNTSSILIASIARACERRERIAGMHFFNPVPLMRLVEVIRGPATSQEVADALAAIGTRMGRTPVIVRDAPGFLVNHGGRAYTTEAIRILHERSATAAQIDAVMRDCRGFRMGPCELMDLTGIDVNYPVSRIVYEGFSDDPRLRTYFPHAALYEAGTFGRKTGSGHFDYGDRDAKAAQDATADHSTDAKPAEKLVLHNAPDQYAAIAFAHEIDCAATTTDDGTSPMLVALVGDDCTTFCARHGLDHKRVVAIDLKGRSDTRVTLMTAPGAEPAHLDAVAAAIARSGRKVTAIKDTPGFVSQRICAMIANLGCEMAQIGVADAHEIDMAMKLGLNYPLGPLELAEDFGLEDMLRALETLQAITGDDRYRPSLWLRRRALLGLPCHTPD